MSTPDCAPHPTTKVCVTAGEHLPLTLCWEPAVCHGCKPCTTHNDPPVDRRPIQRPASNSSARKRDAEKWPAALCICTEQQLRAGARSSTDTSGRIHTRELCSAPDGQEPPA